MAQDSYLAQVEKTRISQLNRKEVETLREINVLNQFVGKIHDTDIVSDTIKPPKREDTASYKLEVRYPLLAIILKKSVTSYSFNADRRLFRPSEEDELLDYIAYRDEHAVGGE